MTGKSLAFPGALIHDQGRSDADLARDVRAHHDAHPGVRFLADVLRALHAAPDAVRTASAFYASFPPRVVMDALEQRTDLRARVVHALTGSPATLLRRTNGAELAKQIELLESEDLAPEERDVRVQDDRAFGVVELYLRYLDPADAAAYLPGRRVWIYENEDGWWERNTDATRRLMAAELKSIRRHAILTDTQLLDRLGDEVLERDLPLDVRVRLRGAARKAAGQARAFTDTDVFDSLRSEDGERDLVDELVRYVSLPRLRDLVMLAAHSLGLESVAEPAERAATTSAAAAASAAPVAPASGARGTATSSPPAAAAPAARASSPAAATAPAARASVPSIPPAPAIPSFAAAASVLPPPLPPSSATTSSISRVNVRAAAQPEPGSQRASAPGAQPPDARTADAPQVELVDDESYGQETTNSTKSSGDSFPDLGDIALPTKANATAKAGGRKR